MQFLLVLLQNTVVLILTALQLAMLVRAIMSWFPGDSNKFEIFLYAITEPLILPVRKLFERLNWFQELPIDVSFFVTYLLLSIVLVLLA